MIGVQFSDPVRNPAYNRAVGDFVSEIVFGAVGRFDKYCSLAVHDDGRLIGGVLYHHFSPDTGVMEMSAAAVDRRWLTRPVLQAMFTVPFSVFACQLVVLRVSERNTQMLRIAKAYGFNAHVIPRLRGRDEAEHILTLSDDDWRANRFNKGRS